MKTLEELVTAMEAMYPVGPSTVHARAVTGEPYISFSIGGTREEGESNSLWGTTKKACIETFWLKFQEYAKGKTGTLYWRRKPEFYIWEVSEGAIDDRVHPVQLLQLSARFLISDSPVISHE